MSSAIALDLGSTRLKAARLDSDVLRDGLAADRHYNRAFPHARFRAGGNKKIDGHHGGLLSGHVVVFRWDSKGLAVLHRNRVIGLVFVFDLHEPCPP